METRYGFFKVTTACPACAHPVVVNGPQAAPVCASCQGKVEIDPATWRKIVGDFEEEYARLEPAAGRECTMMTGGPTLHYTFFRASPPAPVCPKCKGEWDVASVPTGTDGFIVCRTCGNKGSTFPAPDWLKGAVPTAAQVFFAERFEGGGPTGPAVEPKEDGNRAVVLACPRCNGGLSITPRSERTVSCEYCNAEVLIPDAVWLKIHPAKTAKFWGIRFAGERRVADAPAGKAPAAREEPVNFLRDATMLPALLAGTAGSPVMALRINLYPDSAYVVLQNKRSEQDVDGYLVRGRNIDAPTPEHLDPDERRVLRKKLFDAAAVDFSVVPRIVADTISRLGGAGAVDFVSLEKHPAIFGHRLLWQSFVNTGRRRGVARHDTGGKFSALFEM